MKKGNPFIWKLAPVLSMSVLWTIAQMIIHTENEYDSYRELPMPLLAAIIVNALALLYLIIFLRDIAFTKRMTIGVVAFVAIMAIIGVLVYFIAL